MTLTHVGLQQVAMAQGGGNLHLTTKVEGFPTGGFVPEVVYLGLGRLLKMLFEKLKRVSNYTYGVG